MMSAVAAPVMIVAEEELPESYEQHPLHGIIGPPDMAHGGGEDRRRRDSPLCEWRQRMNRFIKRVRRKWHYESWPMRIALILAPTAIILMQIWVACQCISFIKSDGEYEQVPRDDDDDGDEDEEKGLCGNSRCGCPCTMECHGKEPTCGPAEHAAMLENKE